MTEDTAHFAASADADNKSYVRITVEPKGAEPTTYRVSRGGAEVLAAELAGLLGGNVAAEARQHGDGGREGFRCDVETNVTGCLHPELHQGRCGYSSPALPDTTADSDEGPIADAARNIASFTEGAARALVYARAKLVLLEMLTNASRTFPLSRQRVDDRMREALQELVARVSELKSSGKRMTHVYPPLGRAVEAARAALEGADHG